MKRNWPYYVAAFALAVIGVVVLRHYGQLFPSGEVSEVYRRYSVRDDLQVEFFKDFRINDTLVVDVTTIKAADSAGYVALVRELNTNEILIEKQLNSLKKGTRLFDVYCCFKGHPETRTKPDENLQFSFVVQSPREKTVYVFDVDGENQVYALAAEEVRKLRH